MKKVTKRNVINDVSKCFGEMITEANSFDDEEMTYVEIIANRLTLKDFIEMYSLLPDDVKSMKLSELFNDKTGKRFNDGFNSAFESFLEIHGEDIINN